MCPVPVLYHCSFSSDSSSDPSLVGAGCRQHLSHRLSQLADGRTHHSLGGADQVSGAADSLAVAGSGNGGGEGRTVGSVGASSGLKK